MAAKDTDRAQGLDPGRVRVPPHRSHGSTVASRCLAPCEQGHRPATPRRQEEATHNMQVESLCFTKCTVPVAVELSGTFHMRPAARSHPCSPALRYKCQPDIELSKSASRLVHRKLEFIPWASIPRKRTMHKSRVKCAVVTHSRKEKARWLRRRDAYGWSECTSVLKALGVFFGARTSADSQGSGVGESCGVARGDWARKGAREGPAGVGLVPGPLPALRPSVELAERRGQGPVSAPGRRQGAWGSLSGFPSTCIKATTL